MRNVTIVFVVLLIGIEFLFMMRWSHCTNLLGFFHHNSRTTDLQLLDLIHNDYGLPLLVIRIFHNKIVQETIIIYKTFLAYLDPLFLITLSSLAGLMMFLYGTWIVVQKRKKRVFLLLLFGAGIMIEMFLSAVTPFFVRVLLIGVPIAIISILGAIQFLQTNTRWKIIVYLVLIIISVAWYFILPSDLYRFCVQQ